MCGKTHERVSTYGTEYNTEGVKILAEASAIQNVIPSIIYRNHKSWALQNPLKIQSQPHRLKCFRLGDWFLLAGKSLFIPFHLKYHLPIRQIQVSSETTADAVTQMPSPIQPNCPACPACCPIPNSLENPGGHTTAQGSGLGSSPSLTHCLCPREAAVATLPGEAVGDGKHTSYCSALSSARLPSQDLTVRAAHLVPTNCLTVCRSLSTVLSMHLQPPTQHNVSAQLLLPPSCTL